MRLFLAFFRGLALAILVLGLLGAQAAVPVAAGDAARIDAFLLAGGSMADLCTDVGGDGLPDHATCPECQTLPLMALPMAGQKVQDAGLGPAASVTAPRQSRTVRAMLDPAHGTRAPPLA